MTSALVIEDGTIVANATSYVEVDEARAYAAARGITLSVDDTVIDVLAIKAMDYLEAQRARYQGWKVSEIQCLQWPRYEVLIDNIEVEPTSIPILLKQAQCRLMMELNAGVDLYPNRTSQIVKSEKVGPIETEYFQGSSLMPSLSAVDAILEPLYTVNSFLTTIRV
jgi:hypothetical protein